MSDLLGNPEDRFSCDVAHMLSANPVLLCSKYSCDIEKLCHDLQCLMLSEREGSGIAFFKKFNIDFRRATLCGKHRRPENIIKKRHFF